MNTPLVKWAFLFMVLVLAQHFVFKNVAWDFLKDVDKSKVNAALSTFVSGDDTTWSSIEDEESVPLEWSGVWSAKVELNNFHETNLIIDSGATITTISTELADELGLSPSPYLPKLPMKTANGQVEAWVTKLESIRLGETERTNIPVAVLDFGNHSDQGLNGLLGLNFLDGFEWQLDQTHRRLILRPKS